MKKWPWAIVLIALLFASCFTTYGERDRVYPRRNPYDRNIQRYNSNWDFGDIYEYLALYGTWIRYRPYGFVWIPRNMGYRWRPYTHGHWIWSNYGWTWISDFHWGWAVFHYGRWGFDDRIGWFWVPGTVWGPAWVVWRSNDLYFGWAPLPPEVEWRSGYGFGGPFDIPDNFWIFIESPYFLRPGLYSYVLPFERNRTIIRMSELRQNINFRGDRVFNEGFDPDVVRRVTRENLDTYHVRETDQPGPDRLGAGEATLYRPTVKANEIAKPKEFIERDATDETLTRGRIYEPATPREAGDEDSVLRERHNEEEKILERTQSEEIRDLDRRFMEKSAATKEQAEKEKLKKDRDAQVQDLEKAHKAEKAQLKERQKKDTDTIRKRVVKKK